MGEGIRTSTLAMSMEFQELEAPESGGHQSRRNFVPTKGSPLCIHTQIRFFLGPPTDHRGLDTPSRNMHGVMLESAGRATFASLSTMRRWACLQLSQRMTKKARRARSGTSITPHARKGQATSRIYLVTDLSLIFWVTQVGFPNWTPQNVRLSFCRGVVAATKTI